MEADRDVIGLLQNKNRCLKQFLEVSQRFLAEAEQGNLSGLFRFESERESVIKTLKLIDRRITDTVRALPTEQRTAALSNAVQGGLDEEASLVQSILSTDNRIMACVETEKQRLLKEMNDTRKQHELTGKFKSSWVAESGEELDREG